jgi:hypothetical protein
VDATREKTGEDVIAGTPPLAIGEVEAVAVAPLEVEVEVEDGTGERPMTLAVVMHVVLPLEAEEDVVVVKEEEVGAEDSIGMLCFIWGGGGIFFMLREWK